MLSFLVLFGQSRWLYYLPILCYLPYFNLDSPDGYIISQFYAIFLSLTWTDQMVIL